MQQIHLNSLELEKNRNKTKRWRNIAIILFISLLGIAWRNSQTFRTGDYIGLIRIDSEIFEDYEKEDRIKKIAQNHHVKALIVEINSPGGSVVGSEKMYHALRKVSQYKPVIALLGSCATSGAYMTALGADYIMAHHGTLTGSLGVILDSFEVVDAAKSLGIKFNLLKSSPLKGTPNPVEVLAPEAREVLMRNISDVYNFFVQLIATRRELDLEYVKSIADGSTCVAQQALALKLIDKIGNMDDAVEWLKNEKGVQTTQIELIELEKLDVWYSILDKVCATVYNYLANHSKAIMAK
ncbi:putative signal peptide peptidase SppA [Rickettsiales endosymbiont of Paramecium tredecaurelia]|uniref:signal peptide peptidase SppA n=1 Tax=Candidatus Sarmatiella mevalonica TaxID=2770581 RepID=UPI0019242631|nr:signal peptide peptidase SppA [Candidatus Sarmatiella mevalonica]MBL3284834.1 putative signal peptide peptidase SppA [Candidatus Sarmatiella mevalonica]